MGIQLAPSGGGVVIGTILILIGVLLLLFHKPFGRLCAVEQRRLWRGYSDRSMQIATIIGGLGFIALGLLGLSGILK
jgi:hypothetical protein